MGERAELVVRANGGASTQDLFDNAPCGFYSTLPNGLITAVNQTLCTWTGYHRDELVGRRRFQDLLTTGGRIFHETHVAPVLRLQGSVEEASIDMVTADGVHLPLLVNATLLTDGHGMPSAIRGSVIKASGHYGHERELLRARERAERSEARVRVLHQVAAHLAAAPGVGDVAHVMIDAVTASFGAEAGVVWLPDTDRGIWVQVASNNLVDDGWISIAHVPPHSLADGDSTGVWTLDTVRWGYPQMATAMERAGLTTVVTTPLTTKQRQLGLLAFFLTGERSLREDELELLDTLGRQGGQALERARLYAQTVEHARRADFLAHMSRALEEKADLASRARRLVDLLVPDVADRAFVDWSVAGDGVDRIAEAGDEAGIGQPLPSGLIDEAVAQTIATQEPHLVCHDNDGFDRGRVVKATVAESGRVSATVSLVCLPLRLPHRTLGALALVSTGDALLRLSDVAFHMDMAERAALALENARLFEGERETAHTLQRSLLAGDTPRDPRFNVITRYRPAVETLEVGGDWYDVFKVAPGKVGIVVGDVVGRGLEAASAMGQLRSAVRALAGTGLGPARLLEHLDGFAERVEAGRMATLAYAEIALETGQMRYACAGHPPPLLLDAHGETTYLWDGRSGPLRARAGIAMREEAEVYLDPGARLLLYTDGLIERRTRPLNEGLERLRDEYRRRGQSPLATLVEEVSEAMLADERTRDDVCLLCLSFGADVVFERTLRADPTELAPLRADLRKWLTANDVDTDGRDAVVLACSEAAGNAIEHGYRYEPDGVVTVTARVVDGLVRLWVSDTGRWRAPGGNEHRGRGFVVMRELMDEVVVGHGPGTTVAMARRIREVAPA